MFNSQYTFVARWIVQSNLKQKVMSPKLFPVSKYIENLALERGLKNAMLDEAAGVHVLNGFINPEKTCSILKTARDLQDAGKISGILFVSGDSSVTTKESLFDWVKASIGVNPKENSKFLSDLLVSREEDQKRAIVIIDKFDYLMQNHYRENFITSLAEDSVKTKKYNVIICVDNVSSYNEILNWNGRGKIRAIFDDDKS